jgi:hypothetical protein
LGGIGKPAIGDKKMKLKDLNPQYITNDSGEKISVILPINEFQELLEDI